MNHFPGWVDEPDWQKTFKRNAKDIAALWFLLLLVTKENEVEVGGTLCRGKWRHQQFNYDRQG
jgi:hypothetical protein